MSAGPGLRERKKARTRQLIAETANRLFVERGFEAVTVAEVARVADVSEGTVFNYFPTKEDLFFGPMEVVEEGLVEAVRARPSGEDLLAAFARHVLESTARLGRDDVADAIARAARIIEASPALLARERAVAAEAAGALAAHVAEETGASAVEASAVASALMGVQRALVVWVRAAVLVGARGPALEAEAREVAGRAFAVLARGLAGVGRRP